MRSFTQDLVARTARLFATPQPELWTVSVAGRPVGVLACEAGGARLVDVRVPPTGLPVGNGKRRMGRRVLMVGTDCATGKKYSALALARDMKAAGLNADFRATGQTGIMIAGAGMVWIAALAVRLFG